MPRLVDYVVLVGYDFDSKSPEGRGRILQRFPAKSWSDYPYEFHLETFCQPCGWHLNSYKSPPTFFVAYLTDTSGNPYFAACLTFSEAVSQQQMLNLDRKTEANLPNGHIGPKFTKCSPASSSIQSFESLTSCDLGQIKISRTRQASHTLSSDQEINDPNLIRPAELYAPKCLVLLSRHQHFDVLKNCLSLLYTVFADSLGQYSLEQMIATLLGAIDVPFSGGPRLSFSLGAGDRHIIQPPLCDTIPVTRNYVALLFKHLGIYNVILLFTAILSDQKVLLCSRSLNRLTQSCQALANILYPLKYGHTFVPIMPKSLLEYLNAPTPFLYGIHTSYLHLLPNLVDVFIADLDGGSVNCPDGIRVPQLPPAYFKEVVDSLFQILSPDLLTADHLYPCDSHSKDMNPAVRDKKLRAVFLKLFASLFAGYRSCLNITRIHPQPVLHFNQSMFLMLRGIPSHCEFFERLLSTMRFQQFILERGPPFRVCDVFDEVYDVSLPLAHSVESSFSTSLHEETGPEVLSIEHVAQKLLQNECDESPVEHTLTNEATQAHKRIHPTPFPQLDARLVDQLITEAIAKKQHKNVEHHVPEPRFVPQGLILDRQLFRSDMYSEKSRVIREFVADIFNNHLTEALKRRNTIRQDLKSRPIRRLFVDELQRYAASSDTNSPDRQRESNGGERRGMLMWEQFELIVDLIDEALCQESQSEDSGIAPLVMDLCTKFSTEINNIRYYANMTNHIQRHQVWEQISFWENVFNEHVNNQIRLLYLHFSEQEQERPLTRSMLDQSIRSNPDKHQRSPRVVNRRSRFRCKTPGSLKPSEEHVIYIDASYKSKPVYAANVSALEIAAEEMQLGQSRPKDVQDQLEELEESTVYAEIIHFINLIVNFRIPVELGAIASGVYGEPAVSNDQQHPDLSSAEATAAFGHRAFTRNPDAAINEKKLRMQELDRQLASGDNRHGRGRFQEPTSEVALEYILRLETWLRRFVEKVVDQNNLHSDRANKILKKIEDIIEGHLLNLESIYPEVKNIPKAKKPEILSPTLLPNEIVLSIDGYDCVRCQLLIDGRLEFTDCQNLDAASDLSSNATRTTVNSERSQLDELESDVDAMIPSLLPAQGALFVTNYRVIFTGFPRDPYQSNQTIIRSFPISAMYSVKKLGLMRITTTFPAVSSTVPNHHIANSNRPLVSGETKAHRRRARHRNSVHDNQTRHGLVRIEENFDVICLRSLTFQLLKIGFDPDEISQDTRDKLRGLLTSLRYPVSLPLSFNFLPDQSPVSRSNQLSKPPQIVVGDVTSESSMASIRPVNPGFDLLTGRTLPRGGSIRSATEHAVSSRISATLGSAFRHSDDSATAIMSVLSTLGPGAIDPTLRSIIPTSPGYLDLVRFGVSLSTPSLTDRSSVGTHGSSQFSYTNTRVVTYNARHDLCKSYPALLVVPQSINHTCLLKLTRVYRRGRFPVIVWQHPSTGAYLLRGGGFHTKSIINALKRAGTSSTGSTAHLTDKEDSGESGETTSSHSSTSKENARYLLALLELSLVASTEVGNGMLSTSTYHAPDSNDLVPATNSTAMANNNLDVPRQTKSRLGGLSLRTMEGKIRSLGRLPGLSARHKNSQSSASMISDECDSPVTNDGSRLDLSSSNAAGGVPVNRGARTSPTLYILSEKSMPKTIAKHSGLRSVDFVPIEYTTVSEIATSFKALLKACLPIDAMKHSIQHNIFASVANTAGFNVVAPQHNPEPKDPGNIGMPSNLPPSSSQSPNTIQTAVSDSGWLLQLQSLMQTAGIIVDLMDLQGATVAVCLEDGMDVVPQVVALAQVMMDPHYRTIEGFWALVEKEWLLFGHRFGQRLRQTVTSKSESLAPVFLQFLDAVHQLLRQFPLSFEFSDFFLQFLAYHHLSNRFKDFKYDCEADRLASWSEVTDASRSNFQYSLTSNSLWSYIERQHEEWPIFFNFRYCPKLAEKVLRPATNLASIGIWSLYLGENLATGPVFDLDHFSPSYRKQNNRPYEPILRHGLNNTHVEQIYAILGLREGEEVVGWRAAWACAESDTRVRKHIDYRPYLPHEPGPEKTLCSNESSQFETSVLPGNHHHHREGSEPISSVTLSECGFTSKFANSDTLDDSAIGTIPRSNRATPRNQEQFIFKRKEAREMKSALSEAEVYNSHQARLQDDTLPVHAINSEEICWSECHSSSSTDSSDECYAARSAALNHHCATTLNRIGRQSMRNFNVDASSRADSDVDDTNMFSQTTKRGTNVSDFLASNLGFTTRHNFAPMTLSESTLRCTFCKNLILTLGLGHVAVSCLNCGALCHDTCVKLMSKTCKPHRSSFSEKNGTAVAPEQQPGEYQRGTITTSFLADRPALGGVLSPNLPWRNGRSATARFTGSVVSLHDQKSKRNTEAEQFDRRTVLLQNQSKNVTFSGMLYKLGHRKILQQWKLRYFVLDTNRHQLRYYESCSDSMPRGTVDLQEVRSVKLVKNLIPHNRRLLDGGAFELETNTRTYRFAAESMKEAVEWVEQIQNTIQ